MLAAWLSPTTSSKPQVTRDTVRSSNSLGSSARGAEEGTNTGRNAAVDAPAEPTGEHASASIQQWIRSSNTPPSPDDPESLDDARAMTSSDDSFSPSIRPNIGNLDELEQERIFWATKAAKLEEQMRSSLQAKNDTLRSSKTASGRRAKAKSRRTLETFNARLRKLSCESLDVMDRHRDASERVRLRDTIPTTSISGGRILSSESITHEREDAVSHVSMTRNEEALFPRVSHSSTDASGNMQLRIMETRLRMQERDAAILMEKEDKMRATIQHLTTQCEEAERKGRLLVLGLAKKITAALSAKSIVALSMEEVTELLENEMRFETEAETSSAKDGELERSRPELKESEVMTDECELGPSKADEIQSILTTQIETLTASLSSGKRQREDIENALSQTENRLRRASLENRDLLLRNTNLQSEVNRLAGCYERVLSKQVTDGQALEWALSELNAFFTEKETGECPSGNELGDSNDTTTGDVSTLEHDGSRSPSATQKHEIEIPIPDSQINSLHENIKAAKRTFRDLNCENATLRAERQEAADKIKAMMTEINSQSSELAALRWDLEEKSLQCLSLEKSSEGIQREIEEVESALLFAATQSGHRFATNGDGNGRLSERARSLLSSIVEDLKTRTRENVALSEKLVTAEEHFAEELKKQTCIRDDARRTHEQEMKCASESHLQSESNLRRKLEDLASASKHEIELLQAQNFAQSLSQQAAKEEFHENLEARCSEISSLKSNITALMTSLNACHLQRTADAESIQIGVALLETVMNNRFSEIEDAWDNIKIKFEAALANSRMATDGPREEYSKNPNGSSEEAATDETQKPTLGSQSEEHREILEEQLLAAESQIASLQAQLKEVIRAREAAISDRDTQWAQDETSLLNEISELRSELENTELLHKEHCSEMESRLRAALLDGSSLCKLMELERQGRQCADEVIDEQRRRIESLESTLASAGEEMEELRNQVQHLMEGAENMKEMAEISNSEAETMRRSNGDLHYQLEVVSNHLQNEQSRLEAARLQIIFLQGRVDLLEQQVKQCQQDRDCAVLMQEKAESQARDQADRLAQQHVHEVKAAVASLTDELFKIHQETVSRLTEEYDTELDALRALLVDQNQFSSMADSVRIFECGKVETSKKLELLQSDVRALRNEWNTALAAVKAALVDTLSVMTAGITELGRNVDSTLAANAERHARELRRATVVRYLLSSPTGAETSPTQRHDLAGFNATSSPTPAFLIGKSHLTSSAETHAGIGHSNSRNQLMSVTSAHGATRLSGTDPPGIDRTRWRGAMEETLARVTSGFKPDNAESDEPQYG